MKNLWNLYIGIIEKMLTALIKVILLPIEALAKGGFSRARVDTYNNRPTLQHILFKREVHLSITYMNKETAEYIPDFVIDDKIIVEIKALEFLSNKFIAQLVNYLKGTNFQLGYLVNFGAPKFAVISHD